MLTWHSVFNKEKQQLDFSLLFLLKNTEYHVSIEWPQNDTRMSSNIPLRKNMWNENTPKIQKVKLTLNNQGLGFEIWIE
jgi:hypothetical protein